MTMSLNLSRPPVSPCITCWGYYDFTFLPLEGAYNTVRSLIICVPFQGTRDEIENRFAEHPGHVKPRGRCFTHARVLTAMWEDTATWTEEGNAPESQSWHAVVLGSELRSVRL